ncbi:MAG: peptidylprolyl isomerase [Nitrosomonas sp.]|jgi:peptidyl-prolyl cis-trans isomerase B (cyclophilin B)|uniref:peptidylprolyl isomerase n=1 Tax=Nitrosomonas sp. TaxID=42353 RepID=UPI00271C333A|nr:peptidylprolyl isomerase [Nitrosomonas sp.]MBK6957987.1 peptidyl-prolyl cis-trans isomerase [Nitrosomonas sp.]MDO8894952.1 peptidylprolyl isomerase [Nitrosomonas sp.]MDP1550317.1 peptidylprolyl isomerase [Nitrosomonas sp.]MDP1787110.1 peptidylprolyl isomerase [Nitrosomonas sp.]MDP1934265.1 peptidylprolyl isomerase [Nitrosomonas sp.]
MRLRQILIFLFLISIHISVNAADIRVEMKTNLGNIVLELYPDKAPETVENFLKYIEEDFYKNTLFHRVISGFMIQGGGFDTAFKQKPTRPPIQNEAANGLKNEIGTIAMARTSDPHSASAQFFINVANNGFLNYKAPSQSGYGYTVFGKVITGMEVVNKIASAPTGSGGPFPGDVPKNSVIIEEIIKLPVPEKQSPQ